MRTPSNTRDRSNAYTACKDEFRRNLPNIFDLTAGVYSFFFNNQLCIKLPGTFFFMSISLFSSINSQEAFPSATFWTSRCHRCLPLSPPGICLHFHLAQDSAFPFFSFLCSSIRIKSRYKVAQQPAARVALHDRCGCVRFLFFCLSFSCHFLSRSSNSNLNNSNNS